MYTALAYVNGRFIFARVIAIGLIIIGRNDVIFQNIRKIDFTCVWTLKYFQKHSRLALYSISATICVKIKFIRFIISSHNKANINNEYVEWKVFMGKTRKPFKPISV